MFVERGRPTLRPLSDADLLSRLIAAIRQSRRDEVDLIALIAEVDARRLYAKEATSSMFAYCTEVLHLSEQEAYLRITVARLSRKHPVILTMLRDGRLHLSGIARLAKHLTSENRDEVLERAAHRSRREIDELVAELEPFPDAPPTIRKLPARRVEVPSGPSSALASIAASGGTVVSPDREPCPGRVEGPGTELCPDRVSATSRPDPVRPATVEALSPARYKVQFTASGELREKLERLQALMRSSVPDGDLARIIDDAVTEKLERLESRRFARTNAPRKTLADTDTTPSSRHVPAAVRRAVHERDGGRCTYQDDHGRRCAARDRLDFHHHGQPFGRGGEHSVENIRLMCHTHNQLLAEQEYGKAKMAQHRRSASRISEARAVYASARSPVPDSRSRPPQGGGPEP